MNILDAVDAASLSKVTRAVFRFSKELSSVVKEMAFARLSLSVKFHTVLE
jgi:hypothetical protein